MEPKNGGFQKESYSRVPVSGSMLNFGRVSEQATCMRQNNDASDMIEIKICMSYSEQQQMLHRHQGLLTLLGWHEFVFGSMTGGPKHHVWLWGNLLKFTKLPCTKMYMEKIEDRSPET